MHGGGGDVGESGYSCLPGEDAVSPRKEAGTYKSDKRLCSVCLDSNYTELGVRKKSKKVTGMYL